MPRGLPFLLGVTGAGVMALALARVPEVLGEVERFRVRAVEVEGARYLDRDEAVAHMGIPVHLSVWHDLEPVAERLRSHPLVRDARARRRLPSTLVLEVREREPVALLPTPVLVPVDEDGRILPIDPARHLLDLPLLQPQVEVGGLGPASPPGGNGAELAARDLRILAGEVVRLGLLEPGLAPSLSDAAVDPWGDVLLRMGDPRIEIHYRPPLAAGRLREGLRVLEDALQRDPSRAPRGLDLRFEDQVVVRYTPSTRR